MASIAQAYALAKARSILSSRTAPIRCAEFAIAGVCLPSIGGLLNCSQGVEDGFVSLSDPAAWAEIQALPINASYTFPNPENQLGGANPWILRYISQRGGVPVQIDYVKLPEELVNAADRSITVDALLNDYGYDCVLSSYFLLYERSFAVNFLLPHQPFSFMAVSQGYVQKYPTITERMWSWTNPFSRSVWVVSTASSAVALFVQFMCERKKNNRDFLSRHAERWRRFCDQLWSGQYIGFAHVYGTSFFNPMSVLGRFNNFSWAFVVELVGAAYLANLMANITKLQPPSRLVTDLADLPKLGLPACVLNRTSHLTFMAKRFPDVAVKVIESPTVGGLLRALGEGQCGAAVGPNTAFLNSMGISDPGGKLCGVDFTGFPLDTGFYAIPFHRSVSEEEIDAMSTLVSAAIVSGAYQRGVYNVQFSNFRAPCVARATLKAAAASTAAPVPLPLTNVAGIFIVQGVGLAIGILVQIWKIHKLKLARSKYGKWFLFRPEQMVDPDAPPPAPPKTGDPSAAGRRLKPDEVLRGMVESMMQTQEDLNRLAKEFGVPTVDLSAAPTGGDALAQLERLLKVQEEALAPEVTENLLALDREENEDEGTSFGGGEDGGDGSVRRAVEAAAPEGAPAGASGAGKAAAAGAGEGKRGGAGGGEARSASNRGRAPGGAGGSAAPEQVAVQVLSTP